MEVDVDKVLDIISYGMCVRDRVLMELLYVSGMRAFEVVALNVDDINFRT